MSSLAQEESRSISENCTWGQRKRIADGKVTVAYSKFLGYDKAEDGVLKINEEEAPTVRQIYRLFMEGCSPHSIAKELTAQGITTPGGKKIWNKSTIVSILSNEKYRGDALLQKGFTTCFLSKKTKINEGELPQYYVEGAHPYIIEPNLFDMVQQEVARRKSGQSRYSGVTPFSSKLKCGNCGAFYGSKVWHSNSKYRRTIYRCNSKYEGADKCQTPHLNEETIKELFVEAANRLLEYKDDIVSAFTEVKDEIFDTTYLESERNTLHGEMAAFSETMQKEISENARIAQDQGEYQKRYAELVEQFETAKARFDSLTAKIADKQTRCRASEAFVSELAQQNDYVAEFDEKLWHSLVDYATVYSENEISFTFKDGSEIKL